MENELSSNLRMILAGLGLKGLDTEVYLTLLQKGSQTVSRLSEILGAERPTLYLALERLKNLGLLEPYENLRRKTGVKIVSPARLIELWELKKQAAKEQAARLSNLLPQALRCYHRQKPRPTVDFSETKEEFIKVFDNILDEAAGEILFYGNAADVVKLVGKKYDAQWLKRRLKKKIPLKILTPPSPYINQWLENDKQLLRQTKKIVGKQQFTSSFILWGEKMALWEPRRPLAIVIENREIIAMFRHIFTALWDER